LTTTVLSGCGGSSFSSGGFVNGTRHSDAELWAIWRSAQESVSQGIDLNPLQREQHATSAEILPGDARSLSTVPRGLRVSPESDVLSIALFSDTGERRPDPTGLVLCPQPCNVHYAPAYSLYRQRSTRYAASWENSETDFHYLLQYEFENQILNTLGYDMRWR
jgi:hypothetical protein